MVDFIRKLKIHFALNESKSKSEKKSNARKYANKTKTLLHTHKKRNPIHHAKVAIKKN